MFGGIGKKFYFILFFYYIFGYPFYEFKSRKQKIVPNATVSHYIGGDIKIVAIYKIWPNNSNIATKFVFTWIFVAITKTNY